jgi:hypothetical protein
MLRVVLESERTIPRLPSHPEATLGSIVHAALRDFGEQGAEAVLAEIRKALSDDRGKVKTLAFASGAATLREILPVSRISAKLAAARQFADAIPQATRRHSGETANGHKGHAPAHLPPGSWREIGIRSDELQLTGQIDLLNVTTRRCDIIDFKTGSAKSDDGVFVDSYVDQLHCYLMLTRSRGYGPSFRLRLIAGDGSFPVPVDEARVEKLQDLLQAIRAAAPMGAEVEAGSLARVCEACTSCAFRAWCPKYLAEIPVLWRMPVPPFVLPSDVWGVVEKVALGSGSGAFYSVYLRDEAGRLDCVSGVPPRLVESQIQVGSRLGFFAVIGRGPSSGQPQNFLLAAPDDPRHGSHTAMIVSLQG